MPTISFTANLRRHVDCPTATVGGSTVAECLADYFEQQPQVRTYVLDDQAGIRRHVAVFVGREQLRDPVHMPANTGPPPPPTCHRCTSPASVGER